MGRGICPPPRRGCWPPCAATAANVNDMLVFERLFLAAFAALARIRTAFAGKGHLPADFENCLLELPA